MEENKKKLKTFELKITEQFENDQVDFISLVTDPAIEVDWVAFSKDKTKKYKFKIADNSKRMVTGPFMIPNLPIYRTDKDDQGNVVDEYNIMFSEQSIENAVKKFFKNNYVKNINVQHEMGASGAYVVESWIISDPDSDKSKLFGFSNLPKGTWFGTIYIENNSLWDEFIKTGILKGFSVEGLFIQGGLVKESIDMKDEDFYSSVAQYFMDYELNEDNLDKIAELFSKNNLNNFGTNE